MAASFSSIITFCFCCCSSLAFHQMDMAYRYQDIMASVEQLRGFDLNQHLKNNISQIKTVHQLFFDQTPHSLHSKAVTPWKLLHDGAQKISSKSDRSLQTCQNSITETVTAFMKKQTWARKSK